MKDSVDRDLAGPLVSARRRIVVIVEAAGANRIQVSTLATLTRQQQPDRIQLGTIRVLRMRIRRHVVGAVVVIDEQHTRTLRDAQLSRVHS